MSRQIAVSRWSAPAALGLALAMVLGAAPAGASVWGGHNGLVRLSFTHPDSAGGDTLVAVKHAAATSPLGVVVDVYAVLDGVTPVFYRGTQVRALGGFELKLAVEGAPGTIVSQEFPFNAFNVRSEPGSCSVGVTNRGELPIRNGRATLVHWRVRFEGTPRNVRFSLDPAGIPSCKELVAAADAEKKVPGCAESGSQALWVGSAVANLEGLIFGCRCAPAYLNWDGKPDLKVAAGKPGWEETGLFTRE